MNFIGNIIWLLFGGITSSILWFVAGLLCYGLSEEWLRLVILESEDYFSISFGIQHFKFARLGLIPFGARIY